MTTPGSSNCGGAAVDKLHAEKSFAGAGGAGDKRSPSARQAAAGDFVQAADTGGCLGQRR